MSQSNRRRVAGGTTLTSEVEAQRETQKARETLASLRQDLSQLQDLQVSLPDLLRGEETTPLVVCVARGPVSYGRSDSVVQTQMSSFVGDDTEGFVAERISAVQANIRLATVALKDAMLAEIKAIQAHTDSLLAE